MQSDHGQSVLFAYFKPERVAFVHPSRQCRLQVREMPATVGYGGDQALDGGFGLAQLGRHRPSCPRHLASASLALKVVLAHRKGHSVGRKQLRFQAGEDPSLDLSPLNALRVPAGACLPVARTAEPRVGDDREAATAYAAADQPGQQVFGAAA